MLAFHACWVTLQAVAAAAPERGAPAGGVPGRAGADGASAGPRPALARHAICAGVHVFQPGRGRGQPVRCLAARQWRASIKTLPYPSLLGHASRAGVHVLELGHRRGQPQRFLAVCCISVLSYER